MRSVVGLAVLPLIACFIALMNTTSTTFAQPREESSTLLAGRLATVESANRRLTVVLDGDIRMTEVFVPESASIIDGDRELTLADLAILVGMRLQVTYRLDNSRRVAERIIVHRE
jgi:hypothetical protein